MKEAILAQVMEGTHMLEQTLGTVKSSCINTEMGENLFPNKNTAGKCHKCEKHEIQ